MKRDSVSFMDMLAYLVATKKTCGIRWDHKFKSKKLVKIVDRFDEKLKKLLPEDKYAEFVKNLAIEYRKFEEALTSEKEAQ